MNSGIMRPVDYEGIPGFIAPTFYLSPALGDEIFGLVREEVEGDPRFFFSDPSDPDRNYNYVSNDPISEAVKEGYRGAYWDILRRKRIGRVDFPTRPLSQDPSLNPLCNPSC